MVVRSFWEGEETFDSYTLDKGLNTFDPCLLYKYGKGYGNQEASKTSGHEFDSLFPC
jgi:hypothetical protein